MPRTFLLPGEGETSDSRRCARYDRTLAPASQYASAFVLEVKRHKFFAEFLQNQDPDALHAALLARRAKLTKKHGTPLPIDRDVSATAVHRLEKRPPGRH